MTRVDSCIACLLAATLLLTACGGAPAAERASAPTAAPAGDTGTDEPTPAAVATDRYPVTVTHELGEHTFAQAPERVVVIREELLEILLALDVQPVGFGGRLDAPSGDTITDHPYLPQGLLGTPTSIGDSQSPSLERLVALSPDLILFPSDGGAESDLYEPLAEIAPTLAFTPQVRGSWKEIVTQLGPVFNREGQAAEAIATFEAETDARRADLADVVTAAPRVAVIYLPAPESTWILGRDFALGGLVEALGFTAVQPDGLDLGPAGAVEIDVEALSTLEADTIFTIQFSEGVQAGFPAEPILASLDIPIVRGVLDPSRPYTGPFSEQFYQEQFYVGMRAVYGEEAE